VVRSSGSGPQTVVVDQPGEAGSAGKKPSKAGVRARTFWTSYDQLADDGVQSLSALPDTGTTTVDAKPPTLGTRSSMRTALTRKHDQRR